LVQKLVVYPDERVYITCTDVRTFDEKLENVLTDMKDTMQEHSLEVLAAIQIAYPYSIILIKDGDDYKEYINSRIISSSGNITSKETTLYYPDIEVDVPRYESIKIIYEDKNAKPCSANIDDIKLSTTLQRKIDYLHGGTFLDKLDKDTQERILAKKPQVETCPTFSKKDYFVSFADKLIGVMIIAFLALLFGYDNSINSYLAPSVVVIMIGYVVFAHYEAKQYTTCTSCQTGNNLGFFVKRSAIAIALAIASSFVS